MLSKVSTIIVLMEPSRDTMIVLMEPSREPAILLANFGVVNVIKKDPLKT